MGKEPIHHSTLAQQPRQLGKVRRNPARLISAERLGRCWLPRILVIDMRERLPSAVLDDEASEVIFNDPGGGKRREEGIGANEQPADNKPSH